MWAELCEQAETVSEVDSRIRFFPKMRNPITVSLLKLVVTSTPGKETEITKGARIAGETENRLEIFWGDGFIGAYPSPNSSSCTH